MITLYHPELDRTIEVSERAARVHRANGWMDPGAAPGKAADYFRWLKPALTAELERRDLDPSGTNQDQARRLFADDEEES